MQQKIASAAKYINKDIIKQLPSINLTGGKKKEEAVASINDAEDDREDEG